MARIRTIKPAFFRDFDLFQLERETGLPIRVAFAGLWTAADRDGRFRWHARELKLDCLPHDDVDFGDVLAALERGGFIRRYEVSGRAYGLVRSWQDHQRPRNDEEDSKLPAPPDNSDGFVTAQSLGKERKGKEEEGKGTEGSSEAPRRSEPDSPICLEFPTTGPGGSSWRLRRVQVDEWRATYPGVDVLAECRRALAWVKANPGRKKTAKGMPKFLLSWLSRAVDSGRVTYETSASSPELPPSQRDDWFHECQILHGGECGGSLKHRTRMDIDAMKAGTRAAS